MRWKSRTNEPLKRNCCGVAVAEIQRAMLPARNHRTLCTRMYDTITHVYNGHAVLRTASPSERGSYIKVQDDHPILVILKMPSMTKRADSLRVLADSDASTPCSTAISAVVGLRGKSCASKSVGSTIATGVIVKSEKCVICARFSHKHRVFVEELLVLDLNLDDKFDMVLVMPWRARHDPIIDWEKRAGVRFEHRGATESDGPVSAADTPNGAFEFLSETMARAAVSGRSAWSARAVTTPGVVDSERVSDTSRKFSAVRRRGDNSVSTAGVDTHSKSKSRGYSAASRRGDNGVSTTGVATHCSTVTRRGDDNASTPGVDATSCVDGFKRPALKLACCRAVGLHEAGCDQAGLDDAC
ncbi:reverse transcriptase [Phytophthora megakarya]|uniref:Reverse transcriptase n=1 Tax=Phytophthora megakarya TaxID=4795 RepID=A0A225VCM0_9STRA|nr:reverse transcriptase [Phytophthora megakarya]